MMALAAYGNSIRSAAMRLAALLALALGLAACGDGYDPSLDTLGDFRLDVVTCNGMSGGTVAFEYLGRGDSAAVQLQSSLTALPQGVKAGDRVLLRYSFRQPQQGSGPHPISTYRCTRIVTDTVRLAASPDAQRHRSIKLRSLWRTGPYINLRCEVEHASLHRLALLADRATLGADTVVCHLVHDLAGTDTAYYWRDCYGSFFASNITGRPSCRVLRVAVNDEVKPSVKFYDFKIK